MTPPDPRPGGANPDQAEFWDQLAPSWVAAEAQLELVTGPYGSHAIERLGVRPGQRLLDIGCGCGATTLELARRTGEGGAVVGADISAGMIAAAADRAATAHVSNVRFVVADVQTDDVGDPGFDAAFSRFGVMFFSDPVAAFAHVRGVLRPGGTLAFCCWQDILCNEWMFLPATAAMTVTGASPARPGPGEPGPLAFAEPGRVEAVLGGAGFTQIEVTPDNRPIVVPESQLESLVDLSGRVGGVREILAETDDATRARVLDVVREVLTGKIEDGAVRLAAGALVVSARA